MVLLLLLSSDPHRLTVTLTVNPQSADPTLKAISGVGSSASVTIPAMVDDAGTKLRLWIGTRSQEELEDMLAALPTLSAGSKGLTHDELADLIDSHLLSLKTQTMEHDSHKLVLDDG